MKKNRSNRIILPIVVVVIAVFHVSSILLFVGMLPTIVAALVERSRKKTRALTVGAMNLAGCMPYLLELWRGGHSIEKALAIVTDPKTITVMYIAALIGYSIDWAISKIVSGYLYQKGLAREKAISDRQANLVERWGEEVTGMIPLDESGFPIIAGGKAKGK